MKTPTSLAYVIIAIVSAGFASNAEAACTYLTRGLQTKMAEYRNYRDQNLAMQARLLTAEQSCKTRGDAVTLRAQESAQALSCTALKDANSLHQEISSLGERCETVFKELERLQTELKNRFELVHADMEDGMKLLRSSRILQQQCREEIQVSLKMTESFQALDGNIANIETKAKTGGSDYGKLKVTGQALAAQAQTLNQNCGSNESLTAAAPKPIGQGNYAAGGVAVSGRRPSQHSTLTGTQESINAQKKAEALIR